MSRRSRWSRLAHLAVLVHGSLRSPFTVSRCSLRSHLAVLVHGSLRSPFTVSRCSLRSHLAVRGMRFERMDHRKTHEFVFRAHARLARVDPTGADLSRELSLFGMFEMVRGKTAPCGLPHLRGPVRAHSARDAIRTHGPLRERILSPPPLARLGYPRALLAQIWQSATVATNRVVIGNAILAAM